jgi:peroxiredoxin
MHVDRLLFLVALIASLAGTAVMADDASSAAGEQTSTAARQKPADPIILLLRDEAVRSELKCSRDQRRALDELLKKHNRLLLAIRDVGPTGADETARPALVELRQQLAKILNDEQRKRVSGLILQAQGYDALLRSDVIARLELSEKQQQDLTELAGEIRAKAQDLQKPGAAGAPEEVQEKLAEVQKEWQQGVLALLDGQQTEQYAALLGEPFDFSKVKASPALAPEFEAIEAWMNSEPLTIESLRGQVVVVHFFAFGCINCIHNYPWYREWHERLQGKGVTIVGIHTPETQTETDNDLLRASLEKNELKFPVAVDKQKKMWQAWSNNIWPAVYIIDKHGRLRYWWYGELDWEGAGNQLVAERQIEQLLAEQ